MRCPTGCTRLSIQSGDDAQDALSCSLACRSLSAKKPIIIGLFYGKRPIKIRHPMHLCHPVSCTNKMVAGCILIYPYKAWGLRCTNRRNTHTHLSLPGRWRLARYFSERVRECSVICRMMYTFLKTMQEWMYFWLLHMFTWSMEMSVSPCPSRRPHLIAGLCLCICKYAYDSRVQSTWRAVVTTCVRVCVSASVFV